MHETVIANRIIEDAKQYGKVRAIEIELGEVGPIEKHHLEPTLRSLVDWEITITESKAEARCNCGYEGPPHILERGHDFCLYDCPECGEVPEIVHGGDVVIKNVVVNEE